MTQELAKRRAEAIVESLDIPDSYYQLAVDRYNSFADWLHRPNSTVALYVPAVSLQGSFRYGTVNRPLFSEDEYDLDIVAEMQKLTMNDKTQKQVKELLGEEVHAYAQAMKLKDEAEEKNRCWRLPYADTVKFHMDITPTVPESNPNKLLIEKYGVPSDLTGTAVRITDKQHPQYTVMSDSWNQSNPKGFARWFESKMRPEAESRLQKLVMERVYATVDEVPTWEWKTPLQRVIQILKRHRDVMFKDMPDFAPISMIITTLATHAYQGENDIYEALVNVVDRMPNYVSPTNPRVPNPTNPMEDFADKWRTDQRYERNFQQWLKQAKNDADALAHTFNSLDLKKFAEDRLQITLNEETLAKISDSTKRTSPYIIIPDDAPKPWATDYEISVGR